MAGRLLILGLLPAAFGDENASRCQCYRPRATREEYVVSPRMHELLSLEALPRELDWRNRDGVNYVTRSVNQHIPFYCGACYAFSTTSALSDRIRIAQGPSGPEVNLAVQVVLNCDLSDLGCSGGDGATVYKFIKDFGGIPSETCQPYVAEGHDTGKKCTAMDVCRTCDSRGCFTQYEHEVYSVSEYGTIRGEHEMIAELQRGPIACAIATPASFLSHTGGDIYEDHEGTAQIDHLISVVGYGVEQGTKYWILRNSWGTYWGYNGFARVVRGKNNIKIETDCQWATPSNGGKPMVRRVTETPAVLGSALVSIPQQDGHKVEEREPVASVAAADSPACRVPRSGWNQIGGERVLSSRPQEFLSVETLPQAWDWRNISGLNYVTSNTNEHNPEYCASCWAFAVSSALSDRLAVQSNGAWPKVVLSPQMLINCASSTSCSGGDPAIAYDYIHKYGIVDSTCQSYQGRQLECDARGICQTCASGNNEHGLVWPGKCTAVEAPAIYYVSEYGSVSGQRDMKAEIYKRGPIGCGLQATVSFRAYTGGIFFEEGQNWLLNHHVSVAGWGLGRQQGMLRSLEYWIGRNSWGTNWGEDGWFRILMHQHNLGIEHDCDWGVPTRGPPTPSTVLVEDSGARELFLTSGQPHTAGLLTMLSISLGGMLTALLFSALLGLLRSNPNSRADSEATAQYVRIA